MGEFEWKSDGRRIFTSVLGGSGPEVTGGSR